MKKLKEQETTQQSAIELVVSMLNMFSFVEDLDEAVMKLKMTGEDCQGNVGSHSRGC